MEFMRPWRILLWCHFIVNRKVSCSLVAVALFYAGPAVYDARSLEPETGTLVSDGNAMSFGFDTSRIPGGAPATWGPQCAAFLIGPTGGSAIWWRQHPASPKGYAVSLDFMLLDSAMADGTGITFAVAEGAGQHLYGATEFPRIPVPLRR